MGGPLLTLLERRAPHVRLRIRPTDRVTVDDAAATLRGTELMVLPRGFISDLPSADLYRDQWVVMCATDNPLIGNTLRTADLSRLGWIVSYDAPTQYTPADKHLEIAGIQRDVGVAMDNFLALPSVLAGTHRVAILQKRLADQLGRQRRPAHPRAADPSARADRGDLVAPVPTHRPGQRWLQQLFLEAATMLRPLSPSPHQPGPGEDPTG